MNETATEIGATTFSIITLSTVDLILTPIIMMLNISIKCHYAECCVLFFAMLTAEYHFAECSYAECRYAECLGALKYCILSILKKKSITVLPMTKVCIVMSWPCCYDS